MTIEIQMILLGLLALASVVMNVLLLNRIGEARADARALRRELVGKLDQQRSADDELSALSVSVTAIRDNLTKMSEQSKALGAEMLGATTQSSSSLKMMEDSMCGVREYLAEKSQEHQRLQEGYDYSVLKNFCRQIIRCVHRIEALCKVCSPEEAASLESIRLDLLDLLDRNGVEEFEPAVGEEYATLRSLAEVLSHKEMTHDASKVGRVAEVVRSGFKYIYNDDQARLILPAQVKVFAKGVR
jgi:molecular chaperone GrpE (heat shock protein)